jgi:hypothetical protein
MVTRTKNWKKRTTEMAWLIEFRNGSFFESLEADHGTTADHAMRFATKADAERFMNEHAWIYMNGGMALERIAGAQELRKALSEALDLLDERTEDDLSSRPIRRRCFELKKRMR